MNVSRIVRRTAVAASSLCAVVATQPALALVLVEAPVASEARAQIVLQTCGTSCVEPNFAFSQSLWMSHGDGASPMSSSGFYPTPNGPTQYAFAHADLAASQLHVVASGRADADNRRVYASVLASLGDTLIVDGGGPSRLSVDTSGMVWSFNNPGDYYASVTVQVLAQGSLAAFSRGDYDNYQPLASASAALGGADWGSPASLQLPGTLDLVFDTPAVPFEWSVFFFGTYTLTGEQSVNMDLGHTLTVHYDAPQATSVLSASGYLPSSTGWVPPPAVPEPAAAWLMLAGMLALGTLGAAQRRG